MSAPAPGMEEPLVREGVPSAVQVVSRTADGRALGGRCLDCGAVTYTGPCADAALVTVMSTHLMQHAPGRATDLGDVSWEVSATCTVCSYGGRIEVDPEGGLVCRGCGSVWSLDGTDGRRAG